MPAKIRDLDTLYDVLTTCPACAAGDDDLSHTCTEYGLPLAPARVGVDWTQLPTFGGEEPADTAGIWSWDATHLLVGTCASDLEIVPRSTVRDTRIEFRVTAEERDEIAHRAAAAGQSVSDYLRTRALEG